MTRQTAIAAFHGSSQAKTRYCRALATRDWDALAELMTPDAEFSVSDGDTEAVMIPGRDKTRATLQGGSTEAFGPPPRNDLVVWRGGPRLCSGLTGAVHTDYDQWATRVSGSSLLIDALSKDSDLDTVRCA
jgi:hypothetical protein